MVRCPKCSRIYQSGTNRFCTHDGGRLISVAETNPSAQSATSTIEFSASQNEASAEWQPRRQTGRLVLPPQIEPVSNGFGVPRPETVEAFPLKTETINNLQPPAPILDRRPTGRLVLPTEIPDSFAPVGDRSINPTGRIAIRAENTAAMVGQNIKGRYAVDKVLHQDALTVTYLAHDRLGEYRQVLIKIWLDDFPPDTEARRRFNDERGALSHLNHPNIARILDSGDLTEGKPFIITEFPEGLTLREAMQITGQFTPGRTARVVRQIAQALTEAHNNRLTHRNLKPENVMLKNDGTIEQVKVFNFGVAGEEADISISLPYIAPECLIGQLSHVEGDIFALGVIAFEMLTGRKPFPGGTQDELLDSEELGLAVKPTNLRLDLSPTVDAVLERALAFSRAERFHHAREFGESLFNALTESVVYKSTGKLHAQKEIAAEPAAELAAPNNVVQEIPIATEEANPDTPAIKKVEFEQIAPPAKTSSDGAKRSSGKAKWLVAAIIIVGLVTLAAVFLYNRNASEQAGINQPYIFQPAEPKTDLQSVQTEEPAPIVSEPANEQSFVPAAIPPNFIRFENTETNLDGKLAENFVPFSLGYPQNWGLNESAEQSAVTNFLDVSNRISNGFPLEQLLVSWYESKGTFEADRAAFPNLVKKLTTVYAKEIPAFRKVSEGETVLNGRAAYEVKFTGTTKDADDKTVEIYGRTIFVPVGRQDSKSGLLLTMLATNLSLSITSPDDVGEKGELKEILNTFEIDSSESGAKQ
ncbi:MAG: serine/threonine protein kinase [Acidobacteriota bacterium]|nr:serine/threonine protein kinase [Acidobacteriota bacterium]